MLAGGAAHGRSEPPELPDPPASAGKPAAPHLALTVELTGDHVLRGTAVWRYTNAAAAPLDQVHFVLWANFDEKPNPALSGIARAQGFFNSWEPTRTEILAVRDEGGRPLIWSYEPAPAVIQTYSLDRIYLAVALPAPLAPGVTTDIAIDFATFVPHRRYEGGYFSGDTTWRFGWFPQVRHRDAAGWSDELVLTSFTHETTFVVPGRRDIAVLGADEVTQRGREARALSAVPVRSIPFVVSDHLTPASAVIDGIEVTVYTRGDWSPFFDTSAAEAKEKLEQLARILPFYREHYGAYRLRSLKVVESPSTYTAMAADGLILLSDLLFLYDRTWIAWGFYRPLGEIVLAHELAHMWWGIGLGVDFDRTNWLSEGFSQMLSLDYSEHHFGRHGRDSVRPNWFLRWAFANLMGVGLPANELDSVILPSYEDHVRFGLEEPLVVAHRELEHAEENAYRLYHKGYLATRALHALLGPDGTRAALRLVYERKAGDLVTLEDLRTAALETKGVEIASLLDGFVLGQARADLAVTDVRYREELHGVLAHISVRREGDLALPASVTVTSERGQKLRLLWDGVAPADELEVMLDSPPERVVVDAEAWVPDLDRRNNAWPRAVRHQWFAPAPEAGVYTWSLNPLPVHQRYLLGLTLAGRDGTRSAWRAGGGITALDLPQTSDDRAEPYPLERVKADSLVYLEGTWRVRRGTELALAAEVARLGLRTYDGYWAGRLELTPTWLLYEPIELGTTGRTELPRTTLRLGLGYSHLRIDGGASTTADRDDPSDLTEASSTLYLTAGVTRDELLRYGFAVDATVRAGGFRLPRGADERRYSEPVAGLHPYAEAALTALHQSAIPYVGHGLLRLRGAMSTPGSLAVERPALALLPVSRQRTSTAPYDAHLSGAATLALPLLRDVRAKNLLTLWLFVFNDLSLEVRYAAAVGGVWRSARDLSLLRVDPLGEAAAGLRLGVAAFDGASIGITAAAGRPVWPAPRSGGDGWTFFVEIGAGAL